ncbi:UvrD-helicase domain-containing protein (plasmid) [Klebsiella variicola]|nr:UvrD-helicase domain-containing protein [Klebsiella variicola]QQM89236.1 UvrD-helicase domain-containing protein [Klebsiella variicola]
MDRETRNLVLSSLSSITRAYMSRCEETNDTDYNIACREVVLGLRADKVRRLNVTHMIVDEFQDTDEVQLAWLWEHAAHGIKVTAVGDDDQSIYSFRAASASRS